MRVRHKGECEEFVRAERTMTDARDTVAGQRGTIQNVALPRM